MLPSTIICPFDKNIILCNNSYYINYHCKTHNCFKLWINSETLNIIEYRYKNISLCTNDGENNIVKNKIVIDGEYIFENINIPQIKLDENFSTNIKNLFNFWQEKINLTNLLS